MDSEILKNSVVIAVREAPIRRILLEADNPNSKSTINYSEDCPNTLVVDKNIYMFDHAFNSTVTQSELYEALIHPLVLKVMSGYDCTALAYGQTGTGKSYSMGMTAEPMSEDHLGVVPRCLNDILKLLQEQKENDASTMSVSASFIEIYNEKAYDLLALDSAQPIAARGQHRFSGGICKPLSNQMDLKLLLQSGTKNRHVRPTNMNTNSSRSHAIVTIHVKKRYSHSRLNIVDLAGSEGVRRTLNVGMARNEGVYINLGLLAINRVLLSMCAGNTVIPYRDSVLTTVLKDSFHANAHLALLACVSPHVSDLSETNLTLRFAKSAKLIKLTPKQNQQLEKLRNQVRAKHIAVKNMPKSDFRRVLPSSTVIKRPLVVRSQTGAISKRFLGPKKHSMGTKTLQRYNSEMGLTPKAKERARDLISKQKIPKKPDFNLDQIFTSTLLPAVNNSSPMNTPTTVPNIENNDEDVDVDLNQSLLKYTQFNSDLARIDEENDQTIAAGSQLTSSTAVSGIWPLPRSTLVPEETNVPMPRTYLRLSVRLMTQQQQQQPRINRIANNTEIQPILRRSERLASIAESTLCRTFNVPLVKEENQRNSQNNNAKKFKLQDLLQPMSIEKRRSILLNILNTANVNELQKLPCVGEKTAFMLCLQRSSLGRFERWSQVERLPIWKGNRWLRLALANCILSSENN